MWLFLPSKPPRWVQPAIPGDPRKCVGSSWHGTPSGVTMMTYMMVTHPSIITSHSKSFISTFCWLCPCRTFIRKTRWRSKSQPTPLYFFIFIFPLKKMSPDWQNFRIAFSLQLTVSSHSNNVMQYIFAPKNMWCIRRRENGFPVLVAN